MSLGQRIKELRITRNFTQDNIASQLSMGRSNFGHIENNRVVPSSKDLELIADILQTTTDYLLGRTDDPNAGAKQLYWDSEGNIKIPTIAEMKDDYEFQKMIDKITPLRDLITEILNDESIDYSVKQSMLSSLDFSIELIRKYGTTINDDKEQTVPLIGTICAGNGLLAQENIEDHVFYPIKKSADFALRVKGDSMIGAGIDDGDIVYFKQKDWFDYNGQIVAVVTEDGDGSLKRIKWSEKTSKFLLVPENEKYEVMELAPTEFRVCGVYAGHFKPDQYHN